MLFSSSGVFFVVMFASCVAEIIPRTEPEMSELGEEYERGLYTSYFKILAEKLSVREGISSFVKNTAQKGFCPLCNAAFILLLKYFNVRKSPAEIEAGLIALCTSLHITTNACTGLISLNMESIMYILENTKDLSPSKICAVIFQSYSCLTDDPSLEWTVDIDLGPKPQPRVSGSSYKDVSDKIEIIQLTDIHYEPDYMINGNTACKEPMCCRSSQGNATDEINAAGYWGDYRKCDLPWHSVQNLLTHVKTTHKNVDYIYMTGDIVDHAIWDTSVQTNSEAIVKFMKELKAVFGDTPIFPILGNHETTPVNVFAPLSITQQNISTSWLFDLVADIWSVWLPPETRDTILKGGFYTVLVKPGFRVIGINNNVCYVLNWWLLHDAKDPYGQLKWLAETLLEAEKSGEKVHILAHVPTGDPWCLKTWSREYNRIIDRFEHTIAAQFNGHTHFDEYQLFYSSSSQNTSIGVAFNGGSATTFDDLNPNYRVYYVQPQTMNVIDYDTWTFNLTEANLNKDASPNWYKLYSCRQAYELDELSPKQMHDLAYRMTKNEPLLMKYHMNYVKSSDPRLQKGCDIDCQKDYLCQIVTANTADSTQCEEILKEFESH